MKKLWQIVFFALFGLNAAIASINVACSESEPPATVECADDLKSEATDVSSLSAADDCPESACVCDHCPRCLGQGVPAIFVSYAASNIPGTASRFVPASLSFYGVTLDRVSEPPIG